MPSRRELLLILLGFLLMSLLVGGTVVIFDVGQDRENKMDMEAYPDGPEKPVSLNSSNAKDYVVTYEERLFYNDLLASRGHSLSEDESVRTNCNTISASKAGKNEFRIRLECRGGITNAPQLPDSEEFTYSVTYRITENTTHQSEIRNYPFGTERSFNDGRS